MNFRDIGTLAKQYFPYFTKGNLKQKSLTANVNNSVDSKDLVSVGILFYTQEDDHFYFHLATSGRCFFADSNIYFYDFGRIIDEKDTSVYDVVKRICFEFEQELIDKTIIDACPTFYDKENHHLLILYNCKPNEITGINSFSPYKMKIFKFKVERNLFLMTTTSLQFCVNEYGQNVLEYVLKEKTEPFLINKIQNKRFTNLNNLIVENIDELLIPTFNGDSVFLELNMYPDNDLYLDTLRELFFSYDLFENKLYFTEIQFKNLTSKLAYFQKMSTKNFDSKKFDFQFYLTFSCYESDDDDIEATNNFFRVQYEFLEEKFEKFFNFQLMFIK